MAITHSVDQVDENGREILTYGTPDFPIAFFDDELAEVAVPPHWHDEFEIVMIQKGTVQARAAGNSFLLSAGEGFFVNSSILHAEMLKTENGHQRVLVFSPKMISQTNDLIWQSYIEPVLGNAGLPYVRLSASVPWQKEILSLAEKAWVYGAYEKENYPLHVRHCLSQTLSLITAHAGTMESELCYTSQYQRDELRMKKALLFIEQHYTEEITIDDIAKSAEISVSTCLRLFRTVIGTTPVQYLISYRLQRAAEELKRSGSSSIAEVAYACGFSDASYFNRCFRKAYDMTPTAYIALFGRQ